MTLPWAGHVDAINFDRYSFFDRALDYLQLRGRRRVAMIGTGFSSDDREHFAAAVGGAADDS